MRKANLVGIIYIHLPRFEYLHGLDRETYKGSLKILPEAFVSICHAIYDVH